MTRYDEEKMKRVPAIVPRGIKQGPKYYGN